MIIEVDISYLMLGLGLMGQAKPGGKDATSSVVTMINRLVCLRTLD